MRNAIVGEQVCNTNPHRVELRRTINSRGNHTMNIFCWCSLGAHRLKKRWTLETSHRAITNPQRYERHPFVHDPPSCRLCSAPNVKRTKDLQCPPEGRPASFLHHTYCSVRRPSMFSWPCSFDFCGSKLARVFASIDVVSTRRLIFYILVSSHTG